MLLRTAPGLCRARLLVETDFVAQLHGFRMHTSAPSPSLGCAMVRHGSRHLQLLVAPIAPFSEIFVMIHRAQRDVFARSLSPTSCMPSYAVRHDAHEGRTTTHVKDGSRRTIAEIIELELVVGRC
ncbi:hypothetical protein PMIN01_09297 [Paraphaeosphaeria minitans]|uniref:Uncharacterized protein n=1 Tax=Paraphaeosphaeria minitans TaxID=565426 RepID=A0A9P6GDY5_9PLEO|nr:hypothetical protein PMIN01_09297 [Paraphaeosphaeria minitans]